MTETEKDLEILNTGVLRPEFVKNATHFFCKAVIHECENDIRTGYWKLMDNIISYSQTHSETRRVKPICYSDNLLDIFFNQKNTIPMHIFFWLFEYYGCIFGAPDEYTERHYDVYSQLLRWKVKYNRFSKQNDLDMLQYAKLQRRKVCKAFASGDYNITFKLAHKDLNSFINAKELETISVILGELFYKQFDNFDADEEKYAAAYILGRMQGIHKEQNKSKLMPQKC